MKRIMIYKWIKLIAFCLSLFLLNNLYNFAIISPTEYHRFQEHELYVNKDKYKVIAFGSSDCRTSFDPKVAKRILGRECFNYGQAGVFYESGAILSTYYDALVFQKPEIAIFIVPYYELEQEGERCKEPIEGYIHSTIGMNNPFPKLYYLISSSRDDGAVERVFPWSIKIKDEEEPPILLYNIKQKMSDGYKKYDVNWRNSLQPDQPYMGNGFVPHTKARRIKIPEERTIEISQVEKVDGIEGYDLSKLLRSCKKKNIKAYVVVGVSSPEIIINYAEEYANGAARIKSVTDRNDAKYIDMNMLKQEYYAPGEMDWSNSTHLNQEGAKKYTAALSELIKLDLEGINIDNHFYNSLYEYAESLDNATE